MPLGVSYMGTKRQLAQAVAREIELSKPGAVLDLFSGMCAVGSAIAPQRQVWSNDLQYFAWEVARAFFCCEELPPPQMQAISSVRALFEEHQKHLGEQIDPCRLGAPRTDGFDLFTSTYSDSYFGLPQCIEIDSLRYAIDHAYEVGSDEHRWLLLALCRAISRCGTTTGHFAQPLSPKPRNLKKFEYQRSRSIWSEWTSALNNLVPKGSRSWRRRNTAFRSDALALLDQLANIRNRPRVIYADPPYTSDQYSRYYHLYDTLILYDYPAVTGVGRYRPERAVSSFSLKAQVEEAIGKLIAGAASLDSQLILSYPTNGLLKNSREIIPQIFEAHYGRAPAVQEICHTHSTLGGSKGAASEVVVEVIYRAVV